MAGETTQIANMAIKLSEKIFPLFYWEKIGPSDINWECVKPVQHNNRKNHPTDAVYRFVDPYDNKPTYIIFDFKSLADKSINSTSINSALRSMAHTLDCSMVSEGWSSKFLQDNGETQNMGCLMVYNHDASYNRKIAGQIHPSLHSNWPELQPHHEILILEPETLVYLNSIYTDVYVLCGEEKLPSDKKKRGFFQPDLQLQYHKRATHKRYGIPILPEQLNAPFQILRYSVNDSGKEGYIIYYKGYGETSDEFIYLIDYLFNYQLIDHASEILLRLPYATNTAPTQFNRAKREYADTVSPSTAVSEDIVKRLECMTLQSIDRVIPRFLETELGMK